MIELIKCVIIGEVYSRGEFLLKLYVNMYFLNQNLNFLVLLEGEIDKYMWFYYNF